MLNQVSKEHETSEFILHLNIENSTQFIHSLNVSDRWIVYNITYQYVLNIVVPFIPDLKHVFRSSSPRKVSFYCSITFLELRKKSIIGYFRTIIFFNNCQLFERLGSLEGLCILCLINIKFVTNIFDPIFCSFRLI